jgi:Protein phosphatase 2C
MPQVVDAEATARLVMRRYLAITLILVVATAEQVAAMQIGDSAVVVRDGEGSLVALTMPAGTPYAPFFVPLFRFVAAETHAREAHDQIEAFLWGCGIRLQVPSWRGCSTSTGALHSRRSDRPYSRH